MVFVGSAAHAASRDDLHRADVAKVNAQYRLASQSQGMPAKAQERHAELIGLDAESRLQVLTHRQDSKGTQYYRYQQTFRGVPIFGEQVVVSEANGQVRNLFGRRVSNLSSELPQGQLLIGKARALSVAKSAALGKRQASIQFPTGATPLGQPVPRPVRQYDALELGYNRRFSNNWFLSANYTLSRLYGNYPGLVNTDEVTAPGRVSVGAQEAFGQRTRPGTNASRAWDLDEMMFDSHGKLGVDGRLPTDRPHVVKLYGSYLFDFGTNLGLNFYGGSGTPVSKSVQSVYRYPLLVEGRGSLGRTPFMNQTDLLASHEFGLAGAITLIIFLIVTVIAYANFIAMRRAAAKRGPA